MASEGLPAYVVVGRGRWAAVIQGILAKESRRCCFLAEARRRNGESDESYTNRISAELKAAGAQIAWLCVPPCEDLPILIESAISAGLHAVVEKPWLHSEAETEALAQRARDRGVLVGVHFQYCFLDEVERLRTRFGEEKNLRFSGTFTLSRADRLGIPAIHNLGSHLFAIREYAVPRSLVTEMVCGYGLADERRVEIREGAQLIRSIDLVSSEPIIQRFMTRFEAAIPRLAFPLDLRFGARVFAASLLPVR